MLIARLLDYIAAHERSCVDSDWARLEPFFTENAIHEVSGGPPFGGRWEGRRALIAHFREQVERFDRHFDERLLLPRGAPAQVGDSVALPWRLAYRLDRGRVVALIIEGTKVASFSSDQIEFLHDQLLPGADRIVRDYLRRNSLLA